jgi:L-fucose isomerase-like protein
LAWSLAAGSSLTALLRLRPVSRLFAQFEKLGIAVKTLPADATENGAVQSRKDAALYGDFFRSQRDDIDGLVILLPNFGDEVAVAECISRAALNVPILLRTRAAIPQPTFWPRLNRSRG